MKILPYMDAPISQAEFAEMIGVSEARVSQLVSEKVITRGDTAHEWLLSYCERLRDVSAGRAGSDGTDLAYERALLTRSQREAQDLKNKVARGKFAPIGLLADVLGLASSAVVDHMDQVEGQMRKACPDLPYDALVVVLRVLAGARNEWIRVTTKQISEQIEGMALGFEEDAGQPEEEEGE